MAKIFNINLKSSAIATPARRVAQPSAEFYSIFSQEELLDIIHTLEFRREIPLKYSYKGTGAQNWDKFYLKYIRPRWYRNSNPEILLLRDNFALINSHLAKSRQLTIIDVGVGNSYSIKEFIHRLNQMGKVKRYIALDISKELLELSQRNFINWFPDIRFSSCTIDIENCSLSKILLKNQDNLEADDTAKIIFHLGVTMGNHHNRIGVLKNLRNSLGKNDLLVFTNEIGSNSQWDGRARGGFKYHVDKVYAWLKKHIGIDSEDCQLLRKYDNLTDSIVANIKLCHDYAINFSLSAIEQQIEIYTGEEITIWRQHKYEIPELRQEIEQAGLELVHYSTDRYFANIMVICKVASCNSPDTYSIADS
ncbi:MAG TPA: hypothetical protein DDZ80_15655 [Cyanobacteria bacterium UBA8803]|nr:hypothetical protein [Cyanobacteria bacterium UBA9273]HBL59852.1 hypothetical protein [Cyanobacteria bacterium UBA8803]